MLITKAMEAVDHAMALSGSTEAYYRRPEETVMGFVVRVRDVFGPGVPIRFFRADGRALFRCWRGLDLDVD